NFKKIAKIMLPKDYITYLLTGVHSTDYSDASGMLLLDVKNRRWSQPMLDICGITQAQMPKLYESFDAVGTLTSESAKALGLPEKVLVCAGAGDNAAAAVGTGTVGEGRCNISIGTSGTVFISNCAFSVDSHNALHSFAHSDGNYHLMGCMLSAGSCSKWWMEDILESKDYKGLEAPITDDKLGTNHVFFLPYLMGERSPHNDPAARGTFIGMTMDTSRADMTQAVLEGVAFAIRDSVEVAKSLGIKIDRSKICGGGAKSKLWKKMFANILNLEIDTISSEEGPGLGGAMLAAVACGEYGSVEEIAEKMVHVNATVKPDPEIAARYETQYQKFVKIYPTVKELFPQIG
ncbi:MAG: xylulokinase, partial [Eubacteriales bacterium]|nr:xylulokinase [Eubacteriales bacterium]